VLVLPEDTLGLLNWVGANESFAKELLPKAVARMIERLGSAAARHKMYLVVCSDLTEADGAIRNTAFLLDRDGKEIGALSGVGRCGPDFFPDNGRRRDRGR
jgi:predicted amidohydrolase